MSGLRATYLGHSTTLIETDGARVLTDPLLRSSLMGVLRRRHRPPDLPRGAPDAVLISHVHHDHLDLPSLRRLSSAPLAVVPRGAGKLLRRAGFASVEEVSPGDSLEVGSLGVRAVPAAHEAQRRGTEAPPSLGFVVADRDDASVYFAGDTELFAGMAEIAPDLDLALLPVWGWGPTLGPGHMNPRQAAGALELLRPRRAVPIHWGTYTPIGASRLWPWMAHAPARGFVERARETAPETEVVILEPGESISAA